MPMTEQDSQPAQLTMDMEPLSDDLWEQIWSKDNLAKALKRVEANGGAPGVDAMTTGELRPWLHGHWPEIRQLLDAGTYKPRPVRQVSIPKPDGGKRNLGVPTVVDRLVQQAILVILSPIFDPGFSESSFGFRPKRSAHQAVKTAQGYIDEGYAWVVDVDLDSFFDRVQHDVLMPKVSAKVKDKRVLRLIGRFLRAGIMADGIKQPSAEGTPQGSPLSPLLANIMLDDLDKELEHRGHRFVRYADDIRVFVKTERAAQRVLDSVTNYVDKRLRLKVNRQKSKTKSASQSSMLGFGFWFDNAGKVCIRISEGAKRRLKLRLHKLTDRTWGISMHKRIYLLNRFTRSWMAYFKIADTRHFFRDMDGWLRRRLRQVQWRQWPKTRTKRAKLQSLGLPEDLVRRWAGSSKGSWRIAGTALHRALPNSYWKDLGLVAMTQVWLSLRAI